LEDRLSLLKDEQTRMKNEYISLQRTEQELMDKLTVKYGEGSPTESKSNPNPDG
jgi:hypothetical protein